MTAGILLSARLGSTRLARKHLLEVGGAPLMAWLIQRIRREFARELQTGLQLIISTSEAEPDNRAFEQFAEHGVKVFYGAARNIPLRHLQTARGHGLDRVIAVDGDDILCSVSGMRQVHQALEAGKPYVATQGLPFGMNSFGYSTAFLEQMLERNGLERNADEVLETGWGRIFDKTRLTDLPLPFAPDERLRFTLDYADDYRFFAALIESFGADIVSASDADIIGRTLERKFYELNADRSREYWVNFGRQLEQETHR